MRVCVCVCVIPASGSCRICPPRPTAAQSCDQGEEGVLDRVCDESKGMID